MKTLRYLFTALFVLCVTVVNAEDFSIGGIYYNITSKEDKTVKVTCKGSNYSSVYNEYTGDVTIPEKVTYNGISYSVTSIGEEAFGGCSGLTGLEIPNSVTSIGNSAFYNCSGLTSIVIPNSVTSIGEKAFYYCSKLTSVEIGHSVTSIGERAFSGCSKLTSIVIPNSVTSIGDWAFYDCSGLTSIEIGHSVTSIGNNAFYGSTGLTAVYVSDLSAWCNIDFEGAESNPLYYAHKLYLNDELVTELVIPDGVTEIKDYAFYGCSGLKNVKIPNSVTSIGYGAFYNCSGLTRIVIPNSVTSIGNNAFYGCENLKTVYNCSNLGITKSSNDYGYVARYADNVINNASIVDDFIFSTTDGVYTIIKYLGNDTEITLPEDYNGENYAVGESVFKNKTNITKITIPNSVTSIGNYAFNGCTSLKELRIEDGTENLSLGYNYYSSYHSSYSTGEGLFYDCPLETLYLGRNLSYNTDYRYGYSPFYNRSALTSITISNSVTSIVNYAFSGCSGLISIEIPNSVTSIGESAFRDCSGLTSIEIPNSVTNVEGYAFYNCSGLTSVVLNSVTGFDYGIFEGCTDIEKVEFNCPTIGDWFSNKSSIKEVVIGDNVTSIGEQAFYGCTGLTNIEIPNSVTYIGNSAFYDCTGLTSIEIPNSVIQIGSSAFSHCSGLTGLEIPNSVTSIGNSAFYNCSGLTSIVIPNGVTSIGESTFYYCSGLTSVIIPNSVTSIDAFAFYYCSNLTSVVIGNSVTSIGVNAFSDCPGLTSVVIGNSVTSIGERAFYNCSNLKTIYNFSNLTLTKSSTNNGYVAYNAENIINVPNGTIIDNFVFSTIEEKRDHTLMLYWGDADDSEIILPESFNGDSYAIGDDVFSGYKTITKITIPSSVTSIGANAFYGCNNLKTVINYTDFIFTKGSTDYGYIAYYANDVKNKPVAVGDFMFSAEEEGKYVLYEYTGNATEIVLPDSYNGKNYIIGDNVFKGNTSIEKITVPNSVTSIAANAFYGCNNLETVINYSDIAFTKGSTDNGYIAYYAGNVVNAPGATNVDIAGDYVFSAKDGKYTLLAYLGDDAEIVLPEEYNGDSYTVGESVFQGNTDITSVTIPSGVTRFATDAFKDCENLEAVKISDLSAWCGIDFATPETNPLYYARKLYVNNEKITELTIPYDVTEVKPYAFNNATNLKKITISNNVTIVGESAFAGCSAVEHLYISKTIDQIGDYAFSNCLNISEVIVFSKNAKEYNDNIFSNSTYNNAKLYVPYGRKPSYELTTPWSNFREIEEKTFFTVTYIVDGEMYKTETLEVGTEIPAEVPVKDGYTFSGWGDIPTVMPEEDITVEGTFRKNSYTITYIIEGVIYRKKTLEYGAAIPTVPVSTREGYTFSWDMEIPETMPAEDITVTGKYTVNKYTIYLLVEGESFQKGTFKYGAKIPKLPTPEPKKGYTFKWDEEIPATMPAKDLTINGRYIKNGTAVEDVETDTEEVKVVYDLRGNRILDTENLERGVYIINGVKSLIK